MVLLASEFDKSRFLKAADLDKEKKFRISKVTAEVLGQGDDKERKPIVWFTNDERGLVLNKTNLRALQGAFGDNMEAWVGKVVVVFPYHGRHAREDDPRSAGAYPSAETNDNSRPRPGCTAAEAGITCAVEVGGRATGRIRPVAIVGEAEHRRRSRR